MPEHWYYLHTNGSLIHKRSRPDRSDFVRKIWQFVVGDRGSAWIICTEALALGAKLERIQELVEKWGLTDEDAQEFAGRAGLRLFIDGDSWCAIFDDFVDLQESQAGFGSTCLEALADLARPGLEKVIA